MGLISKAIGWLGLSSTPRPQAGEITRKQSVATSSGFGGHRLPASYETYRKMRRHPTIALARALSIAPIVAAEWSIEADEGVPDWQVAFIRDQFIPAREPLVERCLLGGCDYGWQPFEKVFDSYTEPTTGATLVRLRKLKPLLQQMTDILVDEGTGAFLGFKQKDLRVPLEKGLLVNFRVEGTEHHGEPLLENARETWNDWQEANKGAQRYDRKVAGSHWVIHYPEGESEIPGLGLKANAEIAQMMLDSLESSGSIAISDLKKAYSEQLDNGDNQAWRIELMSDASARQANFIERLRYLDTLLARSLLMPERAILEGQFGTLAESETQGDIALTLAELTHKHLTRLINWHAVDQLLALNFGEQSRGAIRLVASPLRDATKAFLKELYTSILTNPSGFLEEFGLIDTDALKDKLGVPKIKEVATTDAAEDEANEIPVEGVDANAPVAATIRKIYASLAKQL